MIYREIYELSPGYHEIDLPDFVGRKKFRMPSEYRVNVDSNGHATPNILHFYYSNSDED